MTGSLPLDEFHRILDILQTIDVGLVVLDHDYHVTLWNGFMENHSGYNLSQLEEHNIFHYFPELAEEWLRQKVEAVFTLRCASFISWELRPYLFNFAASRPFTGMSDVMYQNVTIMPWRCSLYVLVNIFTPPNNHDFASSRCCSHTLNHAK